MATLRQKIGRVFPTLPPLLIFTLFGRLLSVEGISSSATSSSMGASTEQEQLLQQGNYFTLHQTQLSSHPDLVETGVVLTLKMNVDGGIEWVGGIPTLYSVFREQTVRRHQGGKVEGMYTLEAAATRYWICMRENGRLYSVQQQEYQKLQRRKQQRIRHETAKQRTRRRRRRLSPQKLMPPSDCLFKTHEFRPEESYERSVGIYSYPHSNATHGRFLSVSPTSGKGRSYRKAFKNLGQQHPIKITQVPIRHLKQMVSSTKFGPGREFNARVRQCLVTLFQCPLPLQKPSRPRGGAGRHHPLFALIHRCKRRAERTEKPPKCRRERGRHAAAGESDAAVSTPHTPGTAPSKGRRRNSPFLT